ncbi:hypothetical protein ACQ9PS_26545 [Escherichia coli]|uniref:hypothetical protein n=1 Tax=Escherichia coli TaxID=562 RepID=UPI003FD0BCEA
MQSHNKTAIDTPAEEKIPVYQLADYLSTECSDIWALQGKSTETNPLYWLRAMDCADRLMPAQSRQHNPSPAASKADWFRLIYLAAPRCRYIQ